MSFDNRRYINDVGWRTYFRNTVLNTPATENTPALWDTTIYPIDANERGASPMDISTTYFAIDYAGNIFSINYINVGGNQYRTTLKDIFFSGYAPTESLIGIVYKSAYKGYAFAIAPVWLNFLDRIARDKVNSLEKSIFWANDPNARRIPFTNISQPSIPNYRADIVDENGDTFNPMEDYGQNPQFEVYQINDDGTYSNLLLGANITRSLADGFIDSVLFSGTGELITGYILIKN